MVKITPDLISRSAQYLNPVKEFQLDLRSYKIAVIENLSSTNDQFGCIDLSDNSISKLEGLPKLNRLRTIMLINNRIMKVERDFALNCPNLENLILTNNRVIFILKIDFKYRRN
jgi:U2 small nuclear ribonucleoprotein A'